MLTDRFDQAFLLASRLHRDHFRKQGREVAGAGARVPYLSHLLAVAALVLEYGGDEEAAMAALLHDAVEDRGGAPTLALIRRRFGDRVADQVAQVSEHALHPGQDKPPWDERKRAYLAGLEHKSPQALLISAADKLANVRSILKDLAEHGDAVWARFGKGRAGTLRYYRQLADAFTRLGPADLAAVLDAAVTCMEQSARQTAAMSGNPASIPSTPLMEHDR